MGGEYDSVSAPHLTANITSDCITANGTIQQFDNRTQYNTHQMNQNYCRK